MRGKVFYLLLSVHADGITPAYAGKSSTLLNFSITEWDHPRVCGEKEESDFTDKEAPGSPPRMRGKVVCNETGKGRQGITPAYAGKSLRGGIEKTPSLGSPPRMRGKAPIVRDIVRDLGITPAYAGKRLKRSRSTVSHVAIVPLFPSVCNKPVVSDGSPAGRDAPLFLPAENAVPASPAYNLRSL